MAVKSRDLVELVLLGPTNDRRQLQDSPILGDVWIAYAEKPAKALDLLITPFRECPAGPVASQISEMIKTMKLKRESGEEANVAYLQGLVAARLFFEELIRVVVPMTNWWQEQKSNLRESDYSGNLRTFMRWAQTTDEDERAELTEKLAQFSALDRYIALAGVILWAGDQLRQKKQKALEEKEAQPEEKQVKNNQGDIGSLLTSIDGTEDIVEIIEDIFNKISEDEKEREKKAQKGKKSGKVWQVSLNRRATPALEKSVPAVKADAARTLFNVNCREITWAVLDSGIDGNHEAFLNEDGKPSRVVRAFDFSNIRKIISLDVPELKKEDLANLKKSVDEQRAKEILETLAKEVEDDRPINWGLVEELIEIDPKNPDNKPRSVHGTHVAGIIGAKPALLKGKSGAYSPSGMCPDIRLYDFRVLAKSLEDTEFAIIAALQFIRYLNDRNNFIVIHGANLSLSIPHDVRNFACGRTPICDECERLIGNGVVVVAAAGNLGYQRYETKDGQYEGYTAFSITDPGNADGVITVGATHRYWPHTYGVSFFSSRGPTGDGRLKPDLVAPGERIYSCVPGGGWKELDGTSMAAPHVSGAAAMLMARYSELIGQPRQIKRILCESATDLERERTFQGKGMLDVLRAFQHI
jgi:serine protease AprX